MLDDILRLLKSMDGDELNQIQRLIEAKQATYHKPLAFLQEVMGFSPLSEDGGDYAYRMRITDDLMNRYGIVHGGVITTFVDTAMAETAFRLDGDLKKAVTLNLAVNFVKPAEQGELVCRVAPVQNGYRIVLFSAVVSDDEGETVATATGHFYKTAHKNPVA